MKFMGNVFGFLILCAGFAIFGLVGITSRMNDLTPKSFEELTPKSFRELTPESFKDLTPKSFEELTPLDKRTPSPLSKLFPSHFTEEGIRHIKKQSSVSTFPIQTCNCPLIEILEKVCEDRKGSSKIKIECVWDDGKK